MARDLLFEIGTEELPASFVRPALRDLSTGFSAQAAEARLTFETLETFGTPRRLALRIRGLSEMQAERVAEVLGPPVKVAFDAEGKPTPVALKWAQGQGLEIGAVQKKETGKGLYLFNIQREAGRPTTEVLPELLAGLVAKLPFRKSMRWGNEEVTFARPVQWICALFGETPLRFRFGDVESGAVTYGHRFLSKGPLELGAPSRYTAVLEKAGVLADADQRRARIAEAIAKAALAVGGKIVDDPELLETVTFLVEHPIAVLGSFDADFLDLPPEVLISEARGHQKYFSVADGQGKLMPHFVAVSNMPVKDLEVSRNGYQRVLRARLSDARFFFSEDKKRPLAGRVDELKRVVFQQKLGTSYEKMERFRALAEFAAQKLGMPTAPVATVATLCKADLTTGMVGEFPELQGIMGREYTKGVESPEVSYGIYEHYLPRFAGDRLPEGDLGAIVGLADRIDTIVGIIAIGRGPTGAADPFGLRRACLATIAIILGKKYRLSLDALVGRSLELLGARVADPVKTRIEVLDFFRDRLKNLWSENHRKDVVESVLCAVPGGYDDLVDASERLAAMTQLLELPDFDPLATAFRRVVNIVEKQAKEVERIALEPALMTDDAEKRLHEAFIGVRGQVEEAIARRDYPGALKRVVTLKPAVDSFFDTVRVLADDPKVKANRVALLVGIGRLIGSIADFSKLQA